MPEYTPETIYQSVEFNHVPDNLRDMFPYPEGTRSCIPDAAIETYVEIAMLFIADLIQCHLDAGSERDATMENGTLRQAIHDEIAEWKCSTINE